MTVIVYLADGFEEMEAVAPIDLLRRAGAEVITAGVTGAEVTGSHGIRVKTDVEAKKADYKKAEMIVLPGGPGHSKLDESPAVDAAIRFFAENGRWIGAICAAPSLLGKRGLLKGRRATCFPGYEKYCEGATMTGEAVETDGKIITAKGAGVATEFGLELVKALFSAEKAAELGASIQRRG